MVAVTSGFTPAVALVPEARLTAPVSFLRHINVCMWRYVGNN